MYNSDGVIANKILNILNSNSNSNTLTKTDIEFLIDSPDISKIFQFYTNLVKTEPEINKIRDDIKFYSLNKDKLIKLNQLKERKAIISNKLIQKKAELNKKRESLKEIISNTKKESLILKNNKKEEEKLLIKLKILETSRYKVNDIIEIFENFKLIDNYKFMNKLSLKNETIKTEEMTFEKFLDINFQFLIEKLVNSQLKNLPEVLIKQI